MKEGDKRVYKDDFQQVEKCNTCEKLFWANSEFELGNWERNCLACSKKIAREEDKKNKRIIKNGVPYFGYKGQIYAWKLGKEVFYNQEYEPSDEKIILGGNRKMSEMEYVANGFNILEKIQDAYKINT